VLTNTPLGVNPDAVFGGLSFLLSAPRLLVERLDEATDLVRRLSEAVPRLERKLDDLGRDITRMRFNSEDQPKTLEELRQARATLEKAEARLARMEAAAARLEASLQDLRARAPGMGDGGGTLARARDAIVGR
jgi:DNA-binding FadR family transcriptional regulator